MKICPVCRTENADNAMFCINCGEPLRNVPIEKDEVSFPEEKTVANQTVVDVDTLSTTDSDGKPLIVPVPDKDDDPHQTVKQALEEGDIDEEDLKRLD